MDKIFYLIPLAGLIGLLYAFYLAAKVSRADAGTARMKEIARAIQEGAMAFLGREYRTLVVFIIIMFAVICLFIDLGTAVSYLVGSIASGLAGYIGMSIATKANVRTASAARSGLSRALSIAFSGGAVMGLSVVGLGLLGLGILYIIYPYPEIVNGYALGASSIALFARVGGGIYTKAADVAPTCRQSGSRHPRG